MDPIKLKTLIKEEVRASMKEALGSSSEDHTPRTDWIAYGSKVDDFINDMIEEAHELYEEGQDLLYKDGVDPGQHHKFVFLSSRLGFLKNLRYKLAQRYEGLQRE